MSVSVSRAPRCRGGRGLVGNLAATAALVGLLLTSGCSEEPLPQRQVRSDDCLQNVNLAQLNEQIRRCDGVVAAFPTNPVPLNDRYLLHSLAGNEAAACADIARASTLARAKPPGSLDAQLRTELKLRQELCQDPKGTPATTNHPQP